MAPHNTAPNTRSGGWPRQDPDLPPQRNTVERYGTADEPADPGFHTYATSDVSETNTDDDRWPDNWTRQYPGEHEPAHHDDDEPPVRRDYLSTLLWTSGWFAVPLVVLLIRAVFLSGDPDPSCMATGIGSCASPRADALGDLIANSPVWVIALFSALAVAAALRRGSDTRRAATIGFCAAVVAGALITIVYNVA